MATARKAVESADTIDIPEVSTQSLTFCVVGTSPLICNRMSQKAWFELLAPKGKKTAGEKATSLKHDPVAEFRAAPYRIADDKAPTLLAVLPTMFKKAMGTAALDLPGAKKAQILRLISVSWDRIPVYGLPKLFMAITRSADINKTPDVRTRAILPQWACTFTLDFPRGLLRESSVANLLVAAGRQSGIGDWRQEKGSGSFGAFRVCAMNDPEFLAIVKEGTRAAQIQAMADALPYDDETAEMLAWFESEVVIKRGFKEAGRGQPDKGDDGTPWSRSANREGAAA